MRSVAWVRISLETQLPIAIQFSSPYGFLEVTSEIPAFFLQTLMFSLCILPKYLRSQAGQSRHRDFVVPPVIRLCNAVELLSRRCTIACLSYTHTEGTRLLLLTTFHGRIECFFLKRPGRPANHSDFLLPARLRCRYGRECHCFL